MSLKPALPRNRPVRQRAIRAALDLLPDAATIADRIDAIYALATESERLDGRAWYGAAHSIARSVTIGADLKSIEHGAGIVAALSPRCSWDENIARALTFADGDDVGALEDGLDKAEAIGNGADPAEVLGGRKVRSFWRNIVGHSAFVTVDRHAVAITYDRPLSNREIKILERPGAYQYVAACYRAAARRHGIPASELQAVTWLAWRRLKNRDNDLGDF